VVADWEADWTGLAVAEVLAARGVEVRLVHRAVAVGEAIHQYQRNLYIERLDLAGVEILHHLRPLRRDGDAVVFEHVFSRSARCAWTASTRWCVSAGRSGDNGAVRGAPGSAG
jgi:NADPH-dependent 2,4-dienoyl-CoA reductase/sulfur reductase-like enzyme